jgi:signal transduction histidine kinase
MRTNKLNSDGKTSRYFSLQTKLTLSFSILLITASAVSIFVLYQIVRKESRESIRQQIYDIVSISALQIDGDAHSTLVDPNQENNAAYTQIKDLLQNIRRQETDIHYIYTWRRNTDGKISFVVDAETDPNKMSHLGESYDSADGAEPYLLAELAVLNHPMVDKKFTRDKWGIWLSGYAPFYRSDGKMEGILGIDIAAKNVIAREREFLYVALVVFGITILMASMLGRFLGRKLTAPIIKLTIGSEQIAQGDLNHRVVVQSSDEVGRLAESFNRMTESLQKTIMDRNQEIASRKEAEDMLEALNKDLESTIQQLTQANRELKEFTYIAAHDLKSPIRAIGSLAGIISNDCRHLLNEQCKIHLDMLVQRAQRLNDFINGILKYSNLEHSVPQKEKVDTNKIAKDMIDQIGITNKTFEITVGNQLPVILCQKTHITQIFESLLDNSIKYMDKPNGLIRINCIEQNDFWQFSVTDNGPGIDKKYFDTIFQIFQTLNRRDTSEAAGIGLSFVRKIVELYGGKVWVESKIGEGSTFFFTLPQQELEFNHSNPLYSPAKLG